MGQYDCTITPTYENGVLTGQCVDCPEVPAQAAVPEKIIVDPQYGWNASAHSRVALSGNCYVQFAIPAGVIGALCGIASEHIDRRPMHLPHAFYVYSNAGRSYWVVCEKGFAKTTPVVHDAADTFRVERRDDTVRYFVNNKQVHTSATRAFGAQVVVACMYAAPDGVS